MEYKRTYIDGYNVLRKITRFERLMKSNADAARRGFVSYVLRRGRSLGYVTIVFDGHGDPINGGPRLGVVYSLTRTADSWIRFQLERDAHPRMALVVSSDNEVRAHAAACGAGLMTSQDFITPERRSISDPEEDKLMQRELSASEIAFWKKKFEQRRRDLPGKGSPE